MVKFELRDAYFPGAEFIQEGAIGIVTRLMQSFCGTAWRPDEVHLERRAPSDIKGFQSFFGAPIRFSATEDALLFSADWLHHRVPREATTP